VHALAQDGLGFPARGRVANKVGELRLHGRYTFRMKVLTWLLVFAALGVLGYAIRNWRNRWLERQRAAEERFAALMAEAKPPADSSLAQQRLLLEAAARAAEAGEPALSIQLYARLLARYPQTGFAAQARAAVDAQKQKLAKA
jgi:HAMP domain-containing protein